MPQFWYRRIVKGAPLVKTRAAGAQAQQLSNRFGTAGSRCPDTNLDVGSIFGSYLLQLQHAASLCLRAYSGRMLCLYVCALIGDTYEQ